MKCQYCKGNTKDDVYGNCLACGAPRDDRYQITEIKVTSDLQSSIDTTFPNSHVCKECSKLDIDDPEDRKIILNHHTCKKCHHWMAIKDGLCGFCQ